MSTVARPEFDPELKAGLAIVGGMFPPTITPDLIGFMRISYASAPIEALLQDRGIDRVDHVYPGHLGDPVTASVLRPRGATGALPCVLFVHSGGLMFGDRFSGIDLALEWVEQFGCALVTIEYRLAPEHPDPYAREDVYAALEWIAAEADRLQLRRDRLIVCAPAQAVAWPRGPRWPPGTGVVRGSAGSCWDYPMLDDRGITPSTWQFDSIGVWDRVSNETAWSAMLGDARGGADVSPYAAPARATDLAGLPPAFIDVGSAEIFRDEAIDYAQGMWRAGSDAELHVWAGAFHACDIFAPHTAVARSMIRTRNAWVERILTD